ncbi:MAG: hypothetical protein UX17_C0056G0006 [Parcubacteria group bacterium GW2011_GWC2_45_7]|nr:MAG: hypothetical protein UX17_C0056G0006 [Parcubacteria group bacterium GW2011_GWC2_45_7]
MDFTENKARSFMADFTVPAHGIEHICRVRDWAVKIAREEGQDEFLAEIVAFLHDIGRVPEFKNNPELRHHELSYRLAQEWFAQYREFDLLTLQEKEEVLYVVRYHWDDTAEKYPLANILRDADKLDMYGEIGLKRAVEFHRKSGREDIKKNIEANLAMVSRIKTATAKKVIAENDLLRPLYKWIEEHP